MTAFNKLPLEKGKVYELFNLSLTSYKNQKQLKYVISTHNEKIDADDEFKLLVDEEDEEQLKEIQIISIDPGRTTRYSAGRGSSY